MSAKPAKAHDLSAAFDWGRGVGEVNRANRDPMGSARGTGLRGELRAEFERGLSIGYDKPRGFKPAPILPYRQRLRGPLTYA